MLNSLRLLAVPRPAAARRRWKWAVELQYKAKLYASRIEPAEWFHWLVVHRRRYYRPALIVAAALYVLNGFYVLAPHQVGVIERFGRKVLPYAEPGLHYKLPWPVEKLTRIEARRARTLEIGFRSALESGLGDAEPAAYGGTSSTARPLPAQTRRSLMAPATRT
jgi:hypothetical protein